jgi:hypothetical protein
MKNKMINYKEMPNDEESLPRISLIIPYDQKMRSQSGLFDLLTAAADKTEKELMINYPEERVIPVIKKLRILIKGMVCRNHEKSIGIFVSPLTEKVYYFTLGSLSKNYFPPVLVLPGSGQKSYLKNNHAN